MILKRHTITVLRILVYLLIIAIYYELYSQQWLLKYLGFFSLRKIPYLNLLIIFFLCYVIILAALKTESVSFSKSNKWIIASIIAYLLVTSFVIVVHDGFILAARLRIISSASTIFMFMFVSTYFATNERIKEFLTILYFAGVLFAIYSLLEFKGNKEGIGLSDYALYGKTGRITMQGIGPNALAGLMAPLLAVGYYLVKVNRGRMKLFYGGTSLFIIYTITLTMSRKGLLIIIVIILSFAWKRYCNRREIILLAGVCCILVFSNTDFKLRLTKGSISGDVHLSLMASTIPIIKENPLFGIGHNKLVIVQMMTANGIVHNYYLRMAAEYGLVTLFLFLLFMLLVVLKFNAISKYVLYLNKNDRDVSIVLSSILWANILALNFEPGNYFYYWIWFGLAVAWVRNCKAVKTLSRGNHSSVDFYSGGFRDPAV